MPAVDEKTVYVPAPAVVKAPAKATPASASTDTVLKGHAANDRGAKRLKIVLCGDTSVGKSCLITNYLHNSFSEDYEPTVLDVYKGIKNVEKKQCEIEIHDTSGDEHLGVNRKVQYKDADCFMICVAANAKESHENVPRWKAEIHEIES